MCPWHADSSLEPSHVVRIARFAGTLPAKCTVLQCGRRVRIGVHSIWKGLPLSDVNNGWPLVPAMLGTRPYPLGFFFFGSSPRLQAVDEFASKSLTSHQRTDRRRQHQLNSMSMSQDKGARPIAAIQTKVNGDRSEGERAGGLRVEEEEWGSGVKRRARQEHPRFILGPMRNGVCIKSLTGHRSSRRRHCGGESAARFSLPLTQVI